MIERRRTQIVRDAAHRAGRDFDDADERLEAIDEMARQPGFDEERRGVDQFVFERGQILAEFVMKLARDGRPLLFACLCNARGQPPEMRLGRPRLAIGGVQRYLGKMVCSRRHRE